MSSYLLFVLLGLGAGAAYAILGLGLVLKFRSTGVVDFGHGAVAMFAAYVFIQLRSSGVLELPWIWLPHQVTLSSQGLGTALSMLIAVAYSAVLGLILYRLVFRPIQGSSALTKVCAAVGVMLGLQAVAVLNFGTQGRSTPTILPSGIVRVAGLIVPVDRLYFAGLVVVLAAALALVYRYTRFGLATRAADENPVGASLMGLSPTRLAAWNWVLASVLAAVAGILISPIATLDPSSYTLFVVPALGVALVARFRSFAVVAATGLGLGIAQALITKLLTVWTWLPQQGLVAGLPFILIMIVMTVFTPRLAARGDQARSTNPSVGTPRAPFRTALGCFVVGAVALFLLQGSLRSALISSLVTACICLSLVVLTGYIGQVSLAQMSFAGVSAFTLTHLATDLGWPFPLPLIAAALVAVPLGVLLGLPSLRLRGVNLAIVTLAAASAMDAFVFAGGWFSGGDAGRNIGSPRLFGWDLGIARGHEYPRVIFGVFVLLVVCAVGVAVARLRMSATGRMFLAVRSNERAAAAAGINVSAAKLLAFGYASFIAGLGGCLLAYQQGNISGSSFGAFASLSLLAIAYVAGVGRIAGAVVAGVMLSPNGLFVTLADKYLHVGVYATLVAGVALTLTAIQNPDGIASTKAGARGAGEALVRLAKKFNAGSTKVGAPLGPPSRFQAKAADPIEVQWSGERG